MLEKTNTNNSVVFFFQPQPCCPPLSMCFRVQGSLVIPSHQMGRANYVCTIDHPIKGIIIKGITRQLREALVSPEKVQGSKRAGCAHVDLQCACGFWLVAHWQSLRRVVGSFPTFVENLLGASCSWFTNRCMFHVRAYNSLQKASPPTQSQKHQKQTGASTFGGEYVPGRVRNGASTQRREYVRGRVRKGAST